MEEREGKTKKLPLWAKILIAAAVVAAVFLTVFLLRDVPPFSSYRLFLGRAVNSAVNDKERTDTAEGRVVESGDFERIDQEVPFRVTKPLWMPEGFGLEYADYKKSADGCYDVSYKYISNLNSDEFIVFSIRESLPIDPEGFTVDFEELTINGGNVYILDLGEDGSHCEYMDDQGLVVTIGGMVNQETLIKIVENMS